MKRTIFLIIGLLVAGLVVGQVRSLADVQVDTIETISSSSITVTGGLASLSVDILCTQDGGTTDGTILFQGRNGSGGNWNTLNDNLGVIVDFSGNDTLTMTSTGIWHVVIYPAVFREYRFNVTGTASDTTTVSFDYLINYVRK